MIGQGDGKTYAPNVAWVYRPKELDSVLEEMLFTHLEEINELRPVAAFDSARQHLIENQLPKYAPITK